MSTTNSTTSFTKLRGRENFDIWKVSAKSYLVIKGLWSCISEEPKENDSDGIAKDLKALSELTLILDENIYSYISDATTTKQAWIKLEKAFEDSGLSRKVVLLKQLVKMTLDECESVQDYVNQMVTTCLKVGKAGLKIEDEILASLMLAGLPEQYMSLVMAIENASTKLTSDGVKTLLLQDTRLNHNNNNGGGFAYAAKAKSHGTFKFNCRRCGKIGHMAKDCLDKQNDRGNYGHKRENGDHGNGGHNRENGDRENSGRNNGTGFWIGSAF